MVRRVSMALAGTLALALALAPATEAASPAPSRATRSQRSLARRGNDAILRARGPVFSVMAAPRLGVLFAGGAEVIQPVGFGAGLQFRVHALHLGPLRLGGEVQLGHTRFLQRNSVPTPSGSSARRFSALGHTDFALGPSFQLVMGPIFAEVGVAVGLGVSTLVRPFGPFIIDEEDVSDTTAMIRGGGHIGVPIRNNSSITIGATIHKYFSRKQVVARPSPDLPDAPPDTNPFDLMLEIVVGYHFMF